VNFFCECRREAEDTETAEDVDIEELRERGRGLAFAMFGNVTVITLCGWSGKEKSAIREEEAIVINEKEDMELVDSI
jgi:hypothetical protein